MADLPRHPDSNVDTDDDNSVRPDFGSPPCTPGWVKVSGIIALVLVLLFVTVHLAGRGLGGPGSHTPPSSLWEQGAQQP